MNKDQENELISAQVVFVDEENDEQDQTELREKNFNVWKVQKILNSIGKKDNSCKINMDLFLNEILSLMNDFEKQDFYEKIINKINSAYKIGLTKDFSHFENFDGSIRNILYFFETDKLFEKFSKYFPVLENIKTDVDIFKIINMFSSSIKDKIFVDETAPQELKNFISMSNLDEVNNFFIEVFKKNPVTLKVDQYLNNLKK